LDQENDGRVRLLLTTAMVVTYMRPFTKSSLLDLRSFAPTAGRDGELHGRLDQLRDEVYAHTAKEADRRVAFGIGNEAASEGDWIPYAEQYMAFPADLVPDVVDLCRRLSMAMHREAQQAWIGLGRPQGEWF
jgi:hypothetical protein